jgi:hypothetical protein
VNQNIGLLSPLLDELESQLEMLRDILLLNILHLHQQMLVDEVIGVETGLKFHDG